jgi:hypothetical protein
MAITENKEIKKFWTFIQRESPFKFEFSINFQNIILNKHITNSNIFFTLIDDKGIGITFGTQITFTFLSYQDATKENMHKPTWN